MKLESRKTHHTHECQLMHVVLGMLRKLKETWKRKVRVPGSGLISDTCVSGGAEIYPERCLKEEAQGPLFSLFFVWKMLWGSPQGAGCPKSPPPLTYQIASWSSPVMPPVFSWSSFSFAFPQSFDPVLSTRCGFQCTASWLPYSLPPYLLPLCCFSGSCSPALNNPEVLAQPPNNPLFLGSQVSSTHEIPSHGVIQSLAGSPLI